MADLSPAVISARVTHARTRPVSNAFTYGVDYVMLDEAQLDGARTPRPLSIGRRNLVSLHPGDHGYTGDRSTGWVRRIAAEAGVGDIADISLLTHPRYWGYAFNPVSFWFLNDADGALKAVLAEVHNTFGDRHCYLCRAPDGGPIGPDTWIEAEKRFHVSPFFDVQGSYRFRFHVDDRRVGIWIRYDDGEGGGLFTSLIGDRRALVSGELLKALLRRPLGTLKITSLIHWQALKLFAKGVRYHRRPAPQKDIVT